MAKGGKPGGGDSGGGSTWRGGNGNDTAFVLTAEELATTTYDGRGGFDTLDMSEMTTGVTIKLNNYPGSNSILYPYREFTGIFYTMSLSEPDPTRVTGTIKNIESLAGGSGDDFLYIDSSGAKTIDGGPGDDALGANGGNAILIGGTGSDVMLVYWSNNILVGGTYENGVATADGESDTFIIGTSATILDFELGIDRLQIEISDDDLIPAILATEWQDTDDGAMLQVDGKTVVLAGLTAAQASTIQLQFTIGGGDAELTGGPGDDTFYAFNDAENFILPNGSGHDTIAFFDTSEDTLVFSDGGPVSWDEVDVNGEPALLGVYNGGNSSVTLLGLTADDIASLMIEEGSTDFTASTVMPSGDGLLM